jgi:hypothetical protein
MSKFTEEQLNNFRYPPSYTEEQKLANSESEVKVAIQNSATLKNKNTKIFGQGSYSNDTNVKNNSDVDINVRLDDTIFVKIPDGKTDKDYGYSDSSYTFTAYRKDVLDAMIDYFGSKFVIDNDKCITILPNSTRIETDVVPTFKFIRYDTETTKVEGVKFFAKSGKQVINYPLQHIDNGKQKNSQTQKRFKRLTRIFRRIRYKMKDDGIEVSDNITSFLLECLVWNVPNKIFNDYDTWTERLQESIRYIYTETNNKEACENWGEVSELMYLFVGRKWSEKDVNNYMLQMWQYLEF